MSRPIHFSLGPLGFMGLQSGSWRIAACSARVDKLYTNEWDDKAVPCGNCKKTKVFKSRSVQE